MTKVLRNGAKREQSPKKSHQTPTPAEIEGVSSPMQRSFSRRLCGKGWDGRGGGGGVHRQRAMRSLAAGEPFITARWRCFLAAPRRNRPCRPCLFHRIAPVISRFSLSLAWGARANMKRRTKHERKVEEKKGRETASSFRIAFVTMTTHLVDIPSLRALSLSFEAELVKDGACLCAFVLLEEEVAFPLETNLQQTRRN